MSAREVAAALDGTGRAEADLGAAHESGAVGLLQKEDTATTDDWSIAREISAAVPRVGVPVTVLTGFLGAGKTTVLNYLLRQDHGLRIAVLVNEFGEVDIDSQIVASESVEREDMILLKNGCICCTISNSFVESVQRALEGHKDSRPDYLVIETSGVADPAPIITNLQETELDDVLYLDQVLTVVDALNFYAQEMDSATAQSQMSCADAILLSKSDLCTPEQAEAVSAELGRLKPGVRIVPSRRGRVPVSVLFDVGVEGADIGGPSAGAEARATQSTPTPILDKTSDKNRHPSHLNDDGFQSLSFVSSRPFDLKKFRSGFLKELPPVS